MFQIGFLEILIIFVIGLIVIGPNKLPDLVKKIIKLYKKLEIKVDDIIYNNLPDNNQNNDFDSNINNLSS